MPDLSGDPAVAAAAKSGAKRITAFTPQALHIATEGPLGLAARRYCLRHGMRFTTSYHTQFPQYLRARFPFPSGLVLGAALVSRRGGPLHGQHASLREDLAARGFKNLAAWRRGVDTDVFKPRPKEFLNLHAPDRRLRRPGGGREEHRGVPADALGRQQDRHRRRPERARLQAQYPGVAFAGYRFDEDLAAHLAAADVMVFPSRTDTFGLVNLEAMACGVPVAAYPVTGPIDVIEDGVTGALGHDLGAAAARARRSIPRPAGGSAVRSGWDVSTREFEGNLMACHAARLRPYRFRSSLSRS